MTCETRREGEGAMSSFHKDRLKHGGGEERRYSTKEERTLEEWREEGG